MYFWNRTLHVSDRFSVHHQGSSTVYTTMGICHTDFAGYLLAGSGWRNLGSELSVLDQWHESVRFPDRKFA